MLRTVLRSLHRQKRRLALPVSAVLLGVACVSGSLLYGQSLQRTLAEARTASRPDVSVEILPDASAGPDSPGGVPRQDEALLRRLAALPAAASARGTLEGRAFLLGSDGEPTGSPSAATGVNYVPDRHGTDPRYPMTEGRGPRHADEIAVDRRSARRAGHLVGDRIDVIVNGRVRSCHLVGVFKAHDPRLAGGGTLTAFDNATARRQFAPSPGTYASLTLAARPGHSPDALAADAARLLPSGLRVVTRAGLDAEAAAGTDHDKLATILSVFAGIALLASAFLVGNTFTMLSAARAREHALLRAVGATRHHVMRMVLTEALLVGTVASAAGYVAGLGVAAALAEFFAAGGGLPDDLVPPQPLSAGPLAAAFTVGIAVTVLAAFLPARRAAAVAPVAALRTSLPAPARSLRRRNRIGALTTAVGVLIALAATREIGLFAFAVPLLLTGLAVLTPQLALTVSRLLRPPLTRLAGVDAVLALANVARNPLRTAATANALTIGLTLVSAVTVALASLSTMAQRDAEADMPSDLAVTAIDFAEIADDTVGRIARLPHVDAVTATTDVAFRPTGNDSFLYATAVDPAAVGRLVDFTVHAGSLDDLGQGMAVDSGTAAAHGWHLGERVTGRLGSGQERTALRIVALYDGPPALTPVLLSADVLSPRTSAATADSRDGAVDSVLVRAAPGHVADVKRQIRHALGNPTLLVQDRADAGREAARVYAPVLTIMYAMLSVTVMIGALGVANTMGMAVSERVREFGLLRAVGMDRRKVGSILRLEATVVSLLGSALGVVTGGALGALAVVGQSGAVLTVPWGRLLLCFLAAAGIGVLTSLLPGRRAAAVPILSAVRVDDA
ncbi:putative ABC transport system permease protein [Streptomyces sp. V3I8]|uniref:ABC transporter permease n=1 Tax=Streptomyces sp. V3I8 TaxID=3042279 RepID=UPI002787C17F|nr:FtsX-like permease family protein [Streptomyces sp. V3I8]MDQ1041243.1 putative ABC transport system permease protein [Streptomyces sp. V3I8]